MSKPRIRWSELVGTLPATLDPKYRTRAQLAKLLGVHTPAMAPITDQALRDGVLLAGPDLPNAVHTYELAKPPKPSKTIKPDEAWVAALSPYTAKGRQKTLEALRGDGWQTMEDIAEELGCSFDGARRRLRRLRAANKVEIQYARLAENGCSFRILLARPLSK